MGSKANIKANIVVVPFEDKHIPELWNIVSQLKGFFADDLVIDNIEKFIYYIYNEVTDVLVALRGSEVVGCAYLEELEIHKGFACIGLFTKRRSITPDEMVEIAELNIPYWFKAHNLNMLFFVTRADNRALIRLAGKLGFSGEQSLPNHAKIKGELTDYKLYGLLKKKLEGI